VRLEVSTAPNVSVALFGLSFRDFQVVNHSSFHSPSPAILDTATWTDLGRLTGFGALSFPRKISNVPNSMTEMKSELYD
jgi:hypothetical protein